MFDFLKYDPTHPLLFTQFYFWAFFAIVYAGFTLIMQWGSVVESRKSRVKSHSSLSRLHARNIYLMAASWFFYYKTSGIFLLILAFITLSDWLIGQQIYKARYGSAAQANSSLPMREGRGGSLWLALSVCVDLSLLFYFKYAYFFTNIFNDVFGTQVEVFDIFAYIGNGFSRDGRFLVDRIILPVGISFYIFQVISYTVDIYRGKIAPVRNLLDFGFYVSFFPQLVAGPIVRASEFVPQLYKPFFLTRRQFGIAVFWICNGLLKKIILSDYLAVNFIDRVFQSPMLFSGFENFFALLTYSMQVYADFSGYTDIAIGVALLMGFYLPKNFDSPYKSRNPQEFWRRWHQSLSRWLKGYVYIPLGGNRTLFGRPASKLLSSNFNSFLTMLIGGLWHGASWNFVIWGGLNGVGMIVNKCWRALGEHWRYVLMTALAVAMVVARQLTRDAYALVNMVEVWVLILWVGTSIWYVGWLWGYRTDTNRFVGWIDQAWEILQTFVFISFTRLFFRSASNLDPATASREAWQTAKQMVHQIGCAWDNSIILPFIREYKYVVLLFVAGMIIHWLPERFKQRYRLAFAALPLPLMVLAVAVAVLIAYQFITADMQPFIYFQF